MSRRPNRPALALSAASTALLASAGLYLWLLGGPTPPPAIGGHWTLTRADGHLVTDRDFRGRYLLLYFGYTACPDICPTTLASVADALRLLGPKASRLQPLFVSVDPTHDTPAIVRDYARNFGPNLLGLTGSPAQIHTITHEFQITTSVDGRAIDHTAVLLLVSPDGDYLAPFPADDDSQDLARRLSRYVS